MDLVNFSTAIFVYIYITFCFFLDKIFKIKLTEMKHIKKKKTEKNTNFVALKFWVGVNN